MTERVTSTVETDALALLRALPIYSGIGAEGQAVIAAVRNGAVKVGPVATVHFTSVNTDVQAPKN